MRPSVAALLLTACAAPTGAPQTWPPPLGLDVAAAMIRDLDGEGPPEIIVAATGEPNAQGLYRVTGGADFDGRAIVAFTAFVPRLVARPGAIERFDDRLALAYPVKDRAHVELLDPVTLASTATFDLDTLVVKTQLVLGRAGTSAAGPIIAAIGDTDVALLSPGGDAAALPPPPIGTVTPKHWTHPVLVTHATTFAIVATETSVYRTTLAQPITYEEARTDAAPWTGQIAIDLDADDIPEIIGFDPASSAICAVDSGGVTDTPACLPIAVPAGATVTLHAGQLDDDPLVDLAVALADADGNLLDVTFYPNLVIGADLTSDALVDPLLQPMLVSPIFAIIPAGIGGHLFGLGVDGATGCLDLSGPC